MTQKEKEVNEMKGFVTSAGCMTIEHIAVEIRRVRQSHTEDEIRKSMDRLKHYMDIYVADFNLNFPTKQKEKKDASRKAD